MKKTLEEIRKKEERLFQEKENIYIEFGKKLQEKFSFTGLVSYNVGSICQTLDFAFGGKKYYFIFLTIEVSGNYFQSINFDSEFISQEKVNEIEKYLKKVLR